MNPPTDSATSRNALKPPFGTAFRYGVSVACVIAASLLRMALEPVVGHGRVPFITYFLAMVGAAAIGGFGPALLCLVLSTVAAAYFFVGRPETFAMGPADSASLVVFVVVGLSIAAISDAQRREKSRADEAWRRNQDTLDSITDAFAQFDSQWRFTYVNAAAERHFGKSRDQLIGRVLWDVFPEVAGSESHRHMERAARQRITEQYEGPAAVNSRWVRASIYPTADGLAVYWQDIHDRKIAEEQVARLNADLETRIAEFQTLIEVMPTGFYAVDREGKLKVYNRKAAQMWGREPKLEDPDELYCGAFRAYTTEGNLLPMSDRPIRETLKSGTPILNQEVVIKRPDGSRITALVNIAPIRGADGEVVGALNVLVDITERNERELQVEHLNARLVRAMRETHHRVKNNLQVISALLDLQETQGSDMVPVSELQRVREHIRSLSIVHDLLTHQAASDPDVTTLSVKALLDRLLQRIQGMAGGRKLIVRADDANLPVRQGSSLSVLVHELVSNAIKHGKGEIEVEFRAEGDRGQLSVCDEGPGFPEGFNPKANGNTGMELIRSLAEWDLHGQLCYSNRPTGGACVVAGFPLTVPADADNTGK